MLIFKSCFIAETEKLNEMKSCIIAETEKLNEVKSCIISDETEKLNEVKSCISDETERKKKQMERANRTTICLIDKNDTSHMTDLDRLSMLLRLITQGRSLSQTLLDLNGQPHSICYKSYFPNKMGGRHSFQSS